MLRTGETLVIVGWTRQVRDEAVRFFSKLRELPLFDQDCPEPLTFDWSDLMEDDIPEKRLGDVLEGMRLAARAVGRSVIFSVPPSAASFRCKPPYSRVMFVDMIGYGCLSGVADLLALVHDEPNAVHFNLAGPLVCSYPSLLYTSVIPVRVAADVRTRRLEHPAIE